MIYNDILYILLYIYIELHMLVRVFFFLAVLGIRGL
jgi:hypothetical protein